MINFFISSLLFVFMGLGCKVEYVPKPKAGIDVEKQLNDTLSGLSIQVDANFAYYKNRSNESIADEIVLAGYKTVRYLVLNESNVNVGLIQAFHKRGMKVWLQASGSVTYETNGYPVDWPSWKMELNNSVNGKNGYIFLSPFNKSFVKWKKESLARLMVSYPFDGVELTEPYFPEWDAISKGTYGDVGPNAQLAFKSEYGLNMPDFNNPEAANYYKKNPEIYKKWMDCRVNAVNEYLNEVVNGIGGIREVRPDAKVATWSLGIDGGKNSVSLLREYQGLDGAAMVKLVKPDIHFIQTHWPDWVKSSTQLPPDYMKYYKSFVDEIKEAAPDLKIGLQGDIGSGKEMIKSGKWVADCEKAALKHGFSATTFYEYHIGGYMYTEPPVLKKAIRKGTDTIILSFSKRIDSNSAAGKSNYQFRKDGKLISLNIENITVDGNMVILEAIKLPVGKFEILVRNLKDTPELWLFKGYPALELANQTKMIIE
ncbi:hypothetical protein ABDJ41_17050 [Pedobacter sp. ASV1-7]|uniref:hypothetical protein n=1 Tax=Pedobacter sp. ASV1-7 TaxID=3145237 RepID=UPI0032E8E211